MIGLMRIGNVAVIFAALGLMGFNLANNGRLEYTIINAALIAANLAMLWWSRDL